MLIAVVADTHWGARNDHPVLRERMARFHSEVFFPACEARGVKRVVHLGDLFDRRKYVNFLTASACRESFVEALRSRGMRAHVLVGNHDSYYRNTIKQNSVRTLLDADDCVDVVDAPATVHFDSTEACLFPWVCDENSAEAERLMREGPPSVALGHFELAGFEMYRGSVCEHGMDASALGRFDAVLSGHFHAPSCRGNVRYVGAAGQYTWADAGDARGFHFLCTESGRLEYVPNPIECFAVVRPQSASDASEYAGKFVKVVSSEGAEELVAALETAGAADVQTVEGVQTDTAAGVEEVDASAIDTLELVAAHAVRECGGDAAADRLARELYAEAEASL